MNKVMESSWSFGRNQERQARSTVKELERRGQNPRLVIEGERLVVYYTIKV